MGSCVLFVDMPTLTRGLISLLLHSFFSSVYYSGEISPLRMHFAMNMGTVVMLPVSKALRCITVVTIVTVKSVLLTFIPTATNYSL